MRPVNSAIAVRALYALLIALLAGCAQLDPRPDLARLYADAHYDPEQPPIIVIHGLMGSTLVEADTGVEVWPGSLGKLAFSDYRGLTRLEEAERGGKRLIPGELFFGVAGLDFYSGLLGTLEDIGQFVRSKPGVPVGSDDRRRYYVLLYDWRRDNVEAVRALHELIDQIRSDYGKPDLRVDIIAHSNGGLITNYYLRYGPTDVLAWDNPAQWHEASRRIRRVVLLGTPNLGSVTSVKRLFEGFRIALRVVPVEVMSTFSTPFETLPHPFVKSILLPDGTPADIDIYDPEEWRRRNWSVYSPEVMQRVRASAEGPEQGEAQVRYLQATFERHLRRAKRFQLALTPAYADPDVDIAVFGGDCEQTLARALLVEGESGEQLLFSRRQLDSDDLRELHDRLMVEPGDGLVTRSSQLGQVVDGPAPDESAFNFFPDTQTILLCENHGQLGVNPFFQNNLLYFLFAR